MQNCSGQTALFRLLNRKFYLTAIIQLHVCRNLREGLQLLFEKLKSSNVDLKKLILKQIWFYQGLIVGKAAPLEVAEAH